MATTFLEIKNDTYSKLASGISDTATSLTVTTGEGSNFPSAFPFHLTIESEIVSCANRVDDVLTIVRAQQGTSAVAHSAGITVTLNITAKSISDLNTVVNVFENTYGLSTAGKITVGSFGSPQDVTATRKYGAELHYSGNNYDVTALRARAQLVTTDTTATAQGAEIQAANNDGINAGCLNGAVIEAIGKSTSNAATITMMRGLLVSAEWSAKDTITDLRVLHVRVHTRDNATEGYFSTSGYGIMVENEAVGGNGQALTAGIYFKGTNLSGNDFAVLGIDLSGATITTADIKFHHGTTLLDDGTSLTLAGANFVATLGAITLAGAVSGGGQTISNANITVGAGRTLNVSAGTLTLADNQISGDKVEGGTIAAITITTLTTTSIGGFQITGNITCSAAETVDGVDVSAHAVANTGVHGIGASTFATAATLATHAALITGVHGLVITAGKTFTLTNSLTLSGTDASTLDIGTGGTLGTAAYTATTAYEAAGAISTHASDVDAHVSGATAGQLLVATAAAVAVWQNTGVILSAPDISGTVTAASALTLPAFTLGGTITGGNQTVNNLGYVGVANQAAHAHYFLYGAETLTITDNSARAGFYFYRHLAKTSAAYTSSLSGIISNLGISSANTQNWTTAVGIRGFYSSIQTHGSSSGTITGIVGFYSDVTIADGATVTNLYGMYIKTPVVAGNKVINEYGIYIENQNTGLTLNYAIYMAGGKMRLGGAVELNGQAFDAGSGYAQVDTTGALALLLKAALKFDQTDDSAAVADEVSLSGYEISEGHRALAISSEEVVVVETDETKFSHKLPVRINGATYNLMLCAT